MSASSSIICKASIAKISMTSPVDNFNVPTRASLDAETKGSFVRLLANLNIKRSLTSTFVGKMSVYKYCYCYSNLPTTGTKDPLFRQPMRLWLAH